MSEANAKTVQSGKPTVQFSWTMAALLSFPMAFLYVGYVMGFADFRLMTYRNPAVILFTLLYILLVSQGAERSERKASPESRVWAGCLLLTAASFMLLSARQLLSAVANPCAASGSCLLDALPNAVFDPQSDQRQLSSGIRLGWSGWTDAADVASNSCLKYSCTGLSGSSQRSEAESWIDWTLTVSSRRNWNAGLELVKRRRSVFRGSCSSGRYYSVQRSFTSDHAYADPLPAGWRMVIRLSRRMFSLNETLVFSVSMENKHGSNPGFACLHNSLSPQRAVFDLHFVLCCGSLCLSAPADQRSHHGHRSLSIRRPRVLAAVRHRDPQPQRAGGSAQHQ